MTEIYARVSEATSPCAGLQYWFVAWKVRTMEHHDTLRDS